MDWLVEPEQGLFARFDAQPGRRVLKTHTPLDGVVLDRERIAELTGRPAPPKPRCPRLREWLVGWAMQEADPMTSMD